MDGEANRFTAGDSNHCVLPQASSPQAGRHSGAGEMASAVVAAQAFVVDPR